LRKTALWSIFFILILAGSPHEVSAKSVTTFTVRRIVVEGLQRISQGTVLDYLPISDGQRIDETAIRSAIRALFRTGFFSSVAMLRARNTLIIRVHERPSIARFTFTGNHAISKKTLSHALIRAGLVEGRIFDRSVLEEIRQSLFGQYYSHGRYGVQIHTKIRHLPRNRVSIRIRVREGQSAYLRAINFVGNHRFSASTLRGLFKLKTPGLLTWLTGGDKYERKKLADSLNRLRTFYEDQGYANFHLNSVQVALSPTLRGVYITVNLHEGVVYRVTHVELAGRLILPRKTLLKSIRVRIGHTFSRQSTTLSTQKIKTLLGNEGYAFAQIKAIPRLNHVKHTASVIFFIRPGHRVYVHRIIFHGITGTNETVFLENMRQYEGTWLSTRAIKLSKLLIQRIPFVKSVSIKPRRLPGTRDEVDVDVNVHERRSGTANVTLGYGQGEGIVIGGQIALSNFLGTGRLLTVSAQRYPFQTTYNVTYTNPYFSVNNVSETVSTFYTQSQGFNVYDNTFATTDYGFSLTYSFPLSTFASYYLGISPSHTNLLTNCSSPSIYFNFALNPENGSRYDVPSECSNPDGNNVFVDLPGMRFNNVALDTGLLFDDRNRYILATRGSRQKLGLEVGVPPGAQDFWILNFHSQDHVPLFAGFGYDLNAQVELGKSYGKTSEFPPLLNFFGGGPYSVRGYESYTMGPKTPSGIPVGGTFFTYAQNDLVLPQFFGHHLPGEAPNYQLSLFFDVGNVFATPSSFSLSGLRTSAGVSVTWLTPLGAIRFSWAKPLNPGPNDPLSYLQFALGSYF
jgi:outer membrane protein insertion porin family